MTQSRTLLEKRERPPTRPCGPQLRDRRRGLRLQVNATVGTLRGRAGAGSAPSSARLRGGGGIQRDRVLRRAWTRLAQARARGWPDDRRGRHHHRGVPHRPRPCRRPRRARRRAMGFSADSVDRALVPRGGERRLRARNGPCRPCADKVRTGSRRLRRMGRRPFLGDDHDAGRAPRRDAGHHLCGGVHRDAARATTWRDRLRRRAGGRVPLCGRGPCRDRAFGVVPPRRIEPRQRRPADLAPLAPRRACCERSPS